MAARRQPSTGGHAEQQAAEWTAPQDPSSASWPDLSPSVAYPALDPFEQLTGYQRTLQRAQFLHAEQERWS